MPGPAAPGPAAESVTWAPGPWGDTPGPATRHARPLPLGHRPDVPEYPDHGHGDPAADPPTDPHGFPPIPAPEPGWPPAELPPDPLEAAALAGAFAADYLSWDEDDPGRRGRALAEHLAGAVGAPAMLGWDGHGRQRAEVVLPGAVRPDGDDRVLVDVRVRVTPFRALADRADRAAGEAEQEPDVPGVPAAAPAPTARGWRGCASYWVRLIVPVVRDDGRPLVDAGEEALHDAEEDAGQVVPEPGPDHAGGRAAGDEVRSLRPALADMPDPAPDGAW